MYEQHTCPNCGELVNILCDGRELKPYEWCLPCKDANKKRDWEVRWFNHRFKIFSKRDIFTRDGFACYICSTELTLISKDATLDHEVPLSRGGLSTLSNMRLCCSSCNNKKGDMLLDEFLAQDQEPS